MKKLSDFFYQKSGWLLVLITTLITFGYLFGVFIEQSKCFEVEGGITSLGTSFGFTLSNVEQFLSVRTPEMITCYVEFLNRWDNLFALLYGIMYTVWVSSLFKTMSSKLKWLNLFPLLQTVFDFLENFKLSQIASNYLEYNSVEPGDVQLASAFSMIKWTVSGLTFILLLIGLILLIIRKLKKS